MVEIINILGHRCSMAEQCHRLIGGSDFIRENLQHIIKNVAAAFAREVEIGVVREAQRRGLVGLGFVADDQFVFLSDRISHRHSHIAGVALIAVRAQINQTKDGFIGA